MSLVPHTGLNAVPNNQLIPATAAAGGAFAAAQELVRSGINWLTDPNRQRIFDYEELAQRLNEVREEAEWEVRQLRQTPTPTPTPSPSPAPAINQATGK